MSLLEQGNAYLEIDIQRLEQVNEISYVDFSKLYLRKVNKTRMVFGNSSLFVEVDNKVMVETNVHVKQGGEYRRMPYRLPKQGACDLLKGDKFFYEELTKFSDWIYPYPCPAAKGRYEYRGWAPSLKNAPIALLRSGDYMSEQTFKKGKLVYLVLRVYASLLNID